MFIRLRFDDKGIDFVIRKDNDRYHDIQVKSVRGLNYIFFRKEYFEYLTRIRNLSGLLNRFSDPSKS